jgi:predicted nuclease with RNAse H fold
MTDQGGSGHQYGRGVTAPETRTAGIDLAADARRTALAVIVWEPGSARVERLTVGMNDEQIVDAVPSVTRIGIDCALGWPDAFVDFVSAHARVEAPTAVDGGAGWRRTLAYRATDADIRAKTGRWPLSVSTDRLGVTAMRCAGLTGRLAARGIPVDRSGVSGAVAEVYPGATLRAWRFDTRGYRVDPATRRALLAELVTAAPGLDLGPHAERMVTSPDAFDAVIAAFAARAAALGRFEPPPAELAAQARREGWIVLPSCTLAELMD